VLFDLIIVLQTGLARYFFILFSLNFLTDQTFDCCFIQPNRKRQMRLRVGGVMQRASLFARNNTCQAFSTLHESEPVSDSGSSDGGNVGAHTRINAMKSTFFDVEIDAMLKPLHRAISMIHLSRISAIAEQPRLNTD
jgi:hypothetical protein